jgi:hypothetical protein
MGGVARLLPSLSCGADQFFGGAMEQEMTDSNAVDLYEELLFERATKGIRPVLYVSSRKDLECSVLMLLDEPPEVTLAGRRSSVARGFGQHVL